MEVNGYKINIIRKHKKNISIKVENNEIIVFSNMSATISEIEDIIIKNIHKIEKMLEKKELTFLGRTIDVIESNEFKKPEIYNDKLYIDSISNMDKFFKNTSYNIFKERLDLIYPKFKKIQYPILKVRKMKSRWGVCNKKNHTITLNTELITKDYKYIDYVIIHELCHFIHFDHSKKFWEEVNKYEPNYKKLRKELKKV